MWNNGPVMRPESPGGTFNTVSSRILGCLVLIAAAILADACAHEGGGSRHSRPASLYAPEAHSDHGMVSSGSVEATRAGVQILEQGGNAVDAAVAAAFALGVADPGGSGLGGMTYILISLPDGHAIAIDGSATVPLAADAATLLRLRISGEHIRAKAVAVPATLAANVVSALHGNLTAGDAVSDIDRLDEHSGVHPIVKFSLLVMIGEIDKAAECYLKAASIGHPCTIYSLMMPWSAALDSHPEIAGFVSDNGLLQPTRPESPKDYVFT